MITYYHGVTYIYIYYIYIIINYNILPHKKWSSSSWFFISKASHGIRPGDVMSLDGKPLSVMDPTPETAPARMWRPVPQPQTMDGNGSKIGVFFICFYRDVMGCNGNGWDLMGFFWAISSYVSKICGMSRPLSVEMGSNKWFFFMGFHSFTWRKNETSKKVNGNNEYTWYKTLLSMNRPTANWEINNTIDSNGLGRGPPSAGSLWKCSLTRCANGMINATWMHQGRGNFPFFHSSFVFFTMLPTMSSETAHPKWKVVSSNPQIMAASTSRDGHPTPMTPASRR